MVEPQRPAVKVADAVVVRVGWAVIESADYFRLMPTEGGPS